MLPVEMKKNIFWIGGVDFEPKDFHGYSAAPQGTTYNSYLVKDEKNVLFDTVKQEYADEFIRHLKSLTALPKIDYIVVNHAELDHAGALEELVKLCEPEKIFCSPMGKTTIESHFNADGWPLEVKKTGESISIGKRTVQFMETRMVHWPDSMFSYIPEEKLLISNDGFGQNVATSERFSDEIPRHLLENAMHEYYHNIILPFSSKVLALLASIADKKLDIDMIAPDHGLIIRGKEDVAYVLDLYEKFARQKPAKRAVVIYDTMWGSTLKMAEAVTEGLVSAGVPTKIMSLKHYHHSAVMSEVGHAGLVIMGSPTHNNGVLPKVSAMLTYMKGLKPKNKIGAAFGSYGWSGEGADQIVEQLKAMGMDVPRETLKTQYVPTGEALEQCVELGRALAQTLMEKVNSTP